MQNGKGVYLSDRCRCDRGRCDRGLFQAQNREERISESKNGDELVLRALLSFFSFSSPTGESATGYSGTIHC